MWNNGNSKYTEDYCEMLRSLVEEKDDLTNDEYIKEMEIKTGIKLSNPSMSRLMRKINITTKKKTTLYEDSFLPINQERKQNFIKLHNPFSKTSNNNTYHSLLLSSSTDESGFDNQLRREKGRSEIRKSIEKSKKKCREIL